SIFLYKKRLNVHRCDWFRNSTLKLTGLPEPGRIIFLLLCGRIGKSQKRVPVQDSFRRRKGTIGTLLSHDETQIQEGLLSPFLRELDRERFDQFFGLNHERLRAGGEELLRGKGCWKCAVPGLLDLRTLLDNIDVEARELFPAKSRTKVISRALDEFKQAK